jgi:NADH-quinone oxidoreductase subunit H
VSVALKLLFVFGIALLVLAPVCAWIEREVESSPTGASPEGALRELRGLALLPIALVLVVIPFGGAYGYQDEAFDLVVADIEWGLLFAVAMLAMASLAPLAAQSLRGDSNTLLASLRASVQTLSFALALALSASGALLIFGSQQLSEVVSAQDAIFQPAAFVRILEWAPLPAWLEWLHLPYWGLFLQPVAFALFVASGLGACGLPPFEALRPTEGRSGLGERFAQIVIAALATTLFLGGFSIPFLPQQELVARLSLHWSPVTGALFCAALHVSAFCAKTAGVLWIQLMLRQAVPRLAHERVMEGCWIAILPLAAANLVATAFAVHWLGAGS